MLDYIQDANQTYRPGYTNEDRSSFIYWLRPYPFQGFGTLSLKDDQVDDYYIEKKIKKWIKAVSEKENIKLNYVSVITSHYPSYRKHVHLLLIGISIDGGLLAGCSMKTLKNAWYDGTSKFWYFKNSIDKERGVGYFVKNINRSSIIIPGDNLENLRSSNFY